MKYYFPGLISDTVFSKIESSSTDFPFDCHVNSGENALRLALRSLDLKPLSKVVLPAFVCSSVKNAVISEGLTPVLFDLKQDNTFWTEYALERIKTEEIKVVLLVHLYGYVHPDTSAILEFCKINDITVIHDAAQSYGIDKNKIPGLTVYSFGPGKSTTAAGGAVIEGFNRKKLYQSTIKKYALFEDRIVTARSELFVKSRIYNYAFGIPERIYKRILEKLYSVIIDTSVFYGMNSFQQYIAKESIALVEIKRKERALRHQVLKGAIAESESVFSAYDSEYGLYFKCILFIKEEEGRFMEYLKNNRVPFYRLSQDVGNVSLGNPNFERNATRFFEISSEACIPLEEINRVATILKEYK